MSDPASRKKLFFSLFTAFWVLSFIVCCGLFFIPLQQLLRNSPWAGTLDKCHQLTIENMADPHFKNLQGCIFSKVDEEKLLYRLTPDFNDMYKGVEVKTNNDAMRDDRNYAVEKPGGLKRIIFLGDSYTFGWGLSLEKTITKQLDSQLNKKSKVEVMNLAVPGFNTEEEVAILENAGLKYSPDIVIVMYYLNDPDTHGRFSDNPLSSEPAEVLRLVRSYFNGSLAPGERLRVERYLAEQGCLAELNKYKNDRGRNPDDFVVWHLVPAFYDKVRDSFARLQELSRKHHFKVIVTIIPTFDVPLTNYPYFIAHRKISNEARMHSFNLIDLYPIFSRYKLEELRLSMHDRHTSAFANRIIAITLESFLDSYSLLRDQGESQ